MWILTRDHNDYDQHGAYYVKAWVDKPTIKEVDHAIIIDDTSSGCEDIQHIYDGGDRKHPYHEGDIWYNFFEETR